MIDLTQEQRSAILMLGDPERDSAALSREVLDELTRLGIVHRREPDHRLDFTDLGELCYHTIKRESRKS